ncbi:MAG TPA: BamA/TamA family outer membrane protein [Chitinophagaceae bacterium]
MLAGQPFNIFSLLKAFLAGIIVMAFHSCSVVPRNYPANTPFVYDYKINVEGNLKSEEKENLETALAKQLDDSIAVRTTRKLFYRFTFNRPVLDQPPVYKSDNADKSLTYMRALMASLGYFYDSSTYTTDTVFVEPDQYRTTVNFTVKPGKLTTLDSIHHRINHPDLQRLADSTMKESLLKKGHPFAKGVITAEGDRLVELYRNNGYMRFGRDDMMGLWDTLDVSLLQPSLDPFAQLELLQKLKARRDTPTANIEIRLRPGIDSVRLTKYHVGHVNIFPDYGPDTLNVNPDTATIGKGLHVIQFHNSFKARIFKGNIYLRNGEVYSQRRSQRTINRLNSLGAWRLVNIQPSPRPGQDTVDFRIVMTPADKYLFSANLEATQNQSSIAGSLFGLGINVGVQNRNFAKAANQASSNLRFGVELGESSLLQTRQVSFAHKIYFPRPFPRFNWIRERDRDNIRTAFSFNAANTERKDLFNLTSINGSLGYEFQRTTPRTTKTTLISVRPINIEYSLLKRRAGLDDLIANNPSLKNIFTDGFISSVIAGATYTGGTEKQPHIIASNFEYSPFIAGLINSKFLDDQLYRFIKVNAEYTRLFRFNKSSFAVRAFGGMGYALNSTVNEEKRNNLPFFKQYFAGGPNSMRAWALRKLGPGSSKKNFDENPERYGDIQIEFNAEYRFLLAIIAGARVESALFTDVGNVWFMKKEASDDPREIFKLSRLGEDLAVGIGTGVRVDFNFFIIRLDFGYKAKDPTPTQANEDLKNKWFGYSIRKGTQFQLGINYPFKL